MTGGSFMGEQVPLGELMTDGDGRLVFLPAQGRGYSPHSTPLGSYATNPGWTDDVCDGSVRASVKVGSRLLEAGGRG
ncbi:MAG: LodA/GoxA family CTQ-dependent oxidase [Solirubrobacterales bacterium]|nr:LodA/GoxA family CTQ-dependent oxidase [Solirubrobacterales bacterium]